MRCFLRSFVIARPRNGRDNPETFVLAKAGLPRQLRWLAMTVVIEYVLSSCSLAPNYQRPETPPPAEYKEGKGWKLAQPADAIERGKWWMIFYDPKLDALEVKVVSANQNIKVALASYQQARAAAAAARAAFFPTITGNIGESRVQLSHNVNIGAPLTLYNDNVVGADLSYEIDVWGKVRNAAAAAGKRAQASAADLATMDLSMHAELATDYFTLRGYDAAQKVLNEAVIAYQKAYDMTRRRHEGGIAAEMDVDQAQTQLENAKTQSAETQLKRAQLEHAIAVLTGEMPSNFKIDPVTSLTTTLPAIDPGMPSQLLERRPDIAAAERRTAAANADIGVARAAYFPDFTFSLAGGFESIARATLFTSPSEFWSLGPAAVLTLFDAGRIHALSNQAHAAYDQAVAGYRQTVLTAYQEVEDSLVAIRQLEKESVSQASATGAAKKALRQAEYRYKGGIVTYLDVVVAENTSLQAQLSLIDIETRRCNSRIQLVQALGGGWQESSKK